MPASDLDVLRRRLGTRYHIERELGRGGMGAVYLARELELERPVALKVLPTAFAADDSLRERFLRESRLAAGFSHPNIVPVYAVESHPDVLAFAMGFVEGESLAERVASAGPLNARAAVRLMHDVAYALAYAHGRGIVHRDIKPDNLMLERATSRALVMDFGIARRADAVAAPGAGLKRVGEVVGTPEYMSPEQASGDAVDGRSDLYSLGLVMWFALTGRTAVSGDSAQRVLVRQLTETLPPIATVRPDLPPALASAIDRCLAKGPAERFADAGALSQALDDAELAVPEVPLPIRLLANELVLLSAVVPFLLLLSLVVFVPSVLRGLPNVDALVPFVVIDAVVLARVGQALGEAGRLTRLGFDFAAVTRALRVVAAEAASARAARRVEAGVAADRRQSLITAAIMAVIGLASIAGSAVVRKEIAPGVYTVGMLGAALFFNGVACVGVAGVLTIRDPRRMPIGERLFRAFWLRAPGLALLRRAMRGESSRAGPSAAGFPTAGAPAAGDAALAQRLTSLESRVARLESGGEPSARP